MSYDLLNPGFLKNWVILSGEINRRKKGKPFRSLQSLTQATATGISRLSYFRPFRRIGSISPVLDRRYGKMDGAMNSSGFKIIIRGYYSGSKWKKKRKGSQNLQEGEASMTSLCSHSA